MSKKSSKSTSRNFAKKSHAKKKEQKNSSALGHLQRGKNGGNSLAGTGGVKSMSSMEPSILKVPSKFVARLTVEKRGVNKFANKAASTKVFETLSNLQELTGREKEDAEFRREQNSLIQRTYMKQMQQQHLASKANDLSTKARNGIAVANPFAVASEHKTFGVDRRTLEEKVCDVGTGLGLTAHISPTITAGEWGEIEKDTEAEALANQYVLKKKKVKKNVNPFAAFGDMEDSSSEEEEDDTSNSNCKLIFKSKGLNEKESTKISPANPFAFAKSTFFYEGGQSTQASDINHEEDAYNKEMAVSNTRTLRGEIYEEENNNAETERGQMGEYGDGQGMEYFTEPGFEEPGFDEDL